LHVARALRIKKQQEKAKPCCERGTRKKLYPGVGSNEKEEEKVVGERRAS